MYDPEAAPLTTTSEACLGWNATLFDQCFSRWQELTGESIERFAVEAKCSARTLQRLRKSTDKWPSVYLAYRIAYLLRQAGAELEDAELAEVTIDDFVIDED